MIHGILVTCNREKQSSLTRELVEKALGVGLGFIVHLNVIRGGL